MPDEPKPQSWWQTIPGILTAVAAVLTAVSGLIAVLRSGDQPKLAPVTTPAAPAAVQQLPASPQPQAKADPAVQPGKPGIRETEPAQFVVSGLWRDNFGTVSQLVQNGHVFRFDAEGTSCKGGYFRSSGGGTITGHTVQSTYQSNLPSRGSCSGTLSTDGSLITSTCTDSVCGTFVVSTARLQ